MMDLCKKRGTDVLTLLEHALAFRRRVFTLICFFLGSYCNDSSPVSKETV